MAYLHCPNCGRRIKIDSVGNFVARWSTQDCICGAALSIRYEREAMFVRYSKKAKRTTRKAISINQEITKITS